MAEPMAAPSNSYRAPHTWLGWLAKVMGSVPQLWHAESMVSTIVKHPSG
jgi:hypothetical protein